MHYQQLFRPGHSNANNSGCVYEHILKAEKALGKPLPKGVEIHHVDENRRNNVNSNLVVCQDRAYHKLLHARARLIRLGCIPGKEYPCCVCKRILPLENYLRNSRNKSFGIQRACRECQKLYRHPKPQARAMMGGS
jgi:hypothetical protein